MHIALCTTSETPKHDARCTKGMELRRSLCEETATSLQTYKSFLLSPSRGTFKTGAHPSLELVSFVGSTICEVTFESAAKKRQQPDGNQRSETKRRGVLHQHADDSVVPSKRNT